MRRPLVVAAACVVLSAGAGGCYPNRLDGVDYDAVATVTDTTANWAATTYSMSDSVVHLVPPGEQDNISRAFDATIIATVRANMNARGYTSVATPATADFHVRLAVSSTEYQGYYWNYWCGYWGYWYPYGCYYPPYYGTYTYTVGSLFVAISDRRVTTTPNQSPLIWLSVGNGVANNGSTAARITNAINQMFTQSPYIDATP